MKDDNNEQILNPEEKHFPKKFFLNNVILNVKGNVIFNFI